MRKNLAALALAATLLTACAGPATAAPATASPTAAVQAKAAAGPCRTAPKSKACTGALAAEGRAVLASGYLPSGPGITVKYYGTSPVQRPDNHVFLVKSKLRPGAVHKYRTTVDMRAALTGRSCHCATTK